MKDLLRNLLYTGVGAAFLTREKLEEMRQEMVERGNLTREEGKEFVDELLKRSTGAKDQLEIWLHRQVEELEDALQKEKTEETCEADEKTSAQDSE